MLENWTGKDTLTTVIGIATSIITAIVYEWARASRKRNKDRQAFSFFESNHDHVWKHYNINSGKITEAIESFMHLRYHDEKRLKLTWYGTNRALLGEGF